MKTADFKLLVCAIVFLFLNIIVLLIYSQIILKRPNVNSPIDVIFIARNRRRASIQHKIWLKNWQSVKQTRFIVLHTLSDLNDQDTNPGLIHIHTPYENDYEMFIHVAELVPQDNQRSPHFLWMSDTVVPIKPISSDSFRRNTLGWRFFNGFVPDATLFEITNLFEDTIPATLIHYSKMSLFDTYEQFQVHFISGKHNIYSNMSQTVVLPNPRNKFKKSLENESFQVVHITPSSPDQDTLNEILKSTWQSFL